MPGGRWGQRRTGGSEKKAGARKGGESEQRGHMRERGRKVRNEGLCAGVGMRRRDAPIRRLLSVSGASGAAGVSGTPCSAQRTGVERERVMAQEENKGTLYGNRAGQTGGCGADDVRGCERIRDRG